MAATEIDYAWAAGLIDGEGCIFIAKKNPRSDRKNGAKTPNYVVAVKVAMCHEETIQRLYEIFQTGSLHKFEHTEEKLSTSYIWVSQAKTVRGILEKIAPYCITKREEIIVALEFLDLPKWYGGQFRGVKTTEHQQREYEIWDKMRRLKPRTLKKIQLEEATRPQGAV